MKRYIIFGALLVSAITSQAQTNPVDNFFKANYNVTNLAEYANRQIGQVSYVLVQWGSEFANVEQRYVDGGYVKLGESDWRMFAGVPFRDSAIEYARFIGADAVIYATKLTGDFDRYTGNEWISHAAAFYARKYTGGGARLSFTWATNEIAQAEAELQRKWDALPRSTKNRLRPEEYAYINQIYGLRKTDPARYLSLIRQRIAWVEAQ